MNEYIKRKDAEEYIKNFGKGAISDGLKTLDPVDDIVLLARGIDMIPTADVVEVVRCKDCEMSRETEDERYLFCMQFADTVGFRAFCSYGARKEGAENED